MTPSAATSTASATSAPSPSESTQTNPVAPDVVVRSSGGALTSAKYSDDPPTKLPRAAVTPPAGKATALATETPELESAPASPPTRPLSKAPEGGATQFSSPPPAVSTLHAATLDTTTAAVSLDTTTAAVSLDAPTARTLAIDTDQVGPQPDTMRMTAFDAVIPPPPPQAADPITALLTLPATFIATATNLVGVVFASLMGPTPATPAEPPLLWAVLAFVRRQFVNDTPTVTSTVSAPDSLGNITISLTPTDEDGDQLVYSATDGAKGNVALNPDGHSFTYTPKIGQTGTDTLTITANDATNPHIHGLAGLINALSFGLLGYAGHDSEINTVTVKLNTPPSLTASPSPPTRPPARSPSPWSPAIPTATH